MSLKGVIKGTTNRGLKKVGALGQELLDLGEERMSICKSCDTFNPSNMKCDASKGGCGCYMKAKVLVKSSTCPKNKW